MIGVTRSGCKLRRWRVVARSRGGAEFGRIELLIPTMITAVSALSKEMSFSSKFGILPRAGLARARGGASRICTQSVSGELGFLLAQRERPKAGEAREHHGPGRGLGDCAGAAAYRADAADVDSERIRVGACAPSVNVSSAYETERGVAGVHIGRASLEEIPRRIAGGDTKDRRPNRKEEDVVAAAEARFRAASRTKAAGTA